VINYFEPWAVSQSRFWRLGRALEGLDINPWLDVSVDTKEHLGMSALGVPRGYYSCLLREGFDPSRGNASATLRR